MNRSVITEIQNIFYCVDKISAGCCVIYGKQLKFYRTHVRIYKSENRKSLHVLSACFKYIHTLPWIFYKRHSSRCRLGDFPLLKAFLFTGGFFGNTKNLGEFFRYFLGRKYKETFKLWLKYWENRNIYGR